MRAPIHAAKPDLLTVSEVAKRLKCHPHTVRRWIWEGKLSAVKVGDLVRVPLAQVERFLRPARPERQAGKSKKQRKKKGVAALLAAMRAFRKIDMSADVEEMERLIAEGEQEADWSQPLG